MESFCDDDPIGKEDSKRTLLKLRESGETCAAVTVYAISASVDAAPRGGRYLTPKLMVPYDAAVIAELSPYRCSHFAHQ
jgi:hypothetical protein